MKKTVLTCDRCKEDTQYIDSFSSEGEIKVFDLCEKCISALKAFLNALN